jgi:hypothetical protein
MVIIMKKSEWYGIFYFFCNKTKYIQLALNYAAWICANDPKNGEEYLQMRGRITDYNISEKEYKNLSVARGSVLKSFLIMGAMVFLVLLYGFYNGSVSFSRYPDFSKILSFSGIALLTWAGVYQLRYVDEKGGFGLELNKVVHKAFFILLLVIGSFVSLLGAL